MAAEYSNKLELCCEEGITYSVKLFLFGLPLEITKPEIIKNLRKFGFVKMVWPKLNHKAKKRLGKNFLKIILENELNVHRLINACKQENKTFFYNFSYRQNENGEELQKLVKVIPWRVTDSCYEKDVPQDENERLNVFVGGVHPTITAEELVEKLRFVNCITKCRILTDRLNYPKGSAIITFSNIEAYKTVLRLRFMKIYYCENYEKFLEFKPYIVQKCEICGINCGPPFICSNPKCPINRPMTDYNDQE